LLRGGGVRRRDFIALFGGIAAMPALRQARAQNTAKVFRIGYLAGETSRDPSRPANPAFVNSMRDLGYVEGQNYVVEWRRADWQYERMSELARELVQLGVDVIVATTQPAVKAAQRATTQIPIVMAISVDPVSAGLVASLARPGGNTTGLSSANEGTTLKQLDLLALLTPGLSRIAYLVNPAGVTALDPKRPLSRALSLGAQKLNLTIQRIDVYNPADIDNAFARMGADRIEAVMTNSSPLLNSRASQVAALALAHRLPSIAQRREYVLAGGLLSYGESGADFVRRTAYYVDKILKGAKPADLPVELATRFYLAINRKTAAALELTIPPQLIAAADDVIG
jgi:putative ABC transport system substrate-binding protein